MSDQTTDQPYKPEAETPMNWPHEPAVQASETHEPTVHDDKPFDESGKWKGEFTGPTEPSEYEKKMLKDSKSVDALLTEEQRPVELPDVDAEYERKKKAYITKVKVVALDKFGKHPLSNPTTYCERDKKRVIAIMEELLLLPEDVLDKQFNEICTETIFDSKADYSKFSVEQV
jgi:hypothetical protein